MVTQHVTEAWKAYKRNLWDIIASLIVMWIVIAVPFLIALIPVLFVLSSGVVAIGTLRSASAMQALFQVLATNIPMLIISVVFFIVAILAAIALSGGFIKVIYDSLKGRARVDTMINVARKKFWTIIGANLLAGVLIILVLLVIVFPIAIVASVSSLSTVLSTLLFLVGIAVWVLFIVLFGFVNQAVVIDNYKATDAVSYSVKIVSRNYLNLWALFLIFGLISVILSFIPIIGFIVINFVISPLAILAYTSLYIRRKKRR